MSKIICLLLFVVAASLTKVSAVTDEEKTAIHEAIAPILAECSTEHGVSEDELKAAEDAKTADAIKPCFISCVMKKTDILDDKGLYTPEKGLAKLRAFLKSDEDFAKFEETGKECLKVNDEAVSDGEAGCDRAKLILECAIQHKTLLTL